MKLLLVFVAAYLIGFNSGFNRAWDMQDKNCQKLIEEMAANR